MIIKGGVGFLDFLRSLSEAAAEGGSVAKAEHILFRCHTFLFWFWFEFPYIADDYSAGKPVELSAVDKDFRNRKFKKSENRDYEILFTILSRLFNMTLMNKSLKIMLHTGNVTICDIVTVSHSYQKKKALETSKYVLSPIGPLDKSSYLLSDR